MAETWRNRIVRYGTEAPDQLLAHPLNAYKLHPKLQQDTMVGVLDDLGWLSPVLVSERSGRVIDGHLRVSVALSRSEPSIPVAYVDITEAEEAEALATFDPVGALVAYDGSEIDALLQEVESADPSVQALLADLAQDADASTLKEVTEPTEPEGGDAARQIKALLYCDEIATFEQALRLTGEGNRGKAIIMVCQAYIGAHAGGHGQG